MTTPRRIDAKAWWLWGTCLAGLLLGLGLGWKHIGPVGPALVGASPIPPSKLDRVTLSHPFPTRPDPAQLPGTLRIGLYPFDVMTGKPIAEEVHSHVFDLETPWVKAMLEAKMPNVNHAFTFRMRGQIRISAPVTDMHIRSDNGYRITFRDSTGHEAHVDDWENAVTEDFYFQVRAEPGCYDVVIDFANVQGNAYFDLWSEAKDICFYPADAAASDAK